MRLRITDTADILVDCEVSAVRAEDASGSFGVWEHHADFLTVLETSVISWRDAHGQSGYCAVRNGVLLVSGGQVSVATREGHVGDDLATLQDTVLARYREQQEVRRSELTASAKLRMQAIRHMMEALGRGAGANDW